jgi:hypothetical protein
VLFGSHEATGFDRSEALPSRQFEHWYMDSVSYFHHALRVLDEQCLIYFDVDTFTLAPLSDLIALIGRYDFIGTHAPARVTAPTVEALPEAFPEINVGVLGLYNTPKMQAFVLDWLRQYQAGVEIYGNNDQAPLRETLWRHRDVRLYVMPPEYNCRFGFGGFAALPVKVLHGRGMPFEAAARVVNYTAGMRAWTNADLHQTA